ncbi:retron St85 family RNA-directed DNA polymerase [Sphingopyxis panaciterrulae]|uniref:RNA-directed DNA polymerase n=1 Tax=Sphingopyxis panaciterrulae TaxID=462372 RepID=A0A7W9B2F7_9SPHN|nr:retron St85 family RNA-directed DNA polymerase [Sphingopyxis panaciterrulae]MBB5705017.1 hypothetical protein [Sphingopyxis panaciterrulae]
MTSKLIEFLVSEVGLSARNIERLIQTAPERYKVYHIRKRSGGWREIAQPATELKIVQRAIVEKYLKHLPIHPAATAYVPGSSIRRNAAIHSVNGPILKYDFKEFFPSITERAWLRYCEIHGIFDRVEAIQFGRLLFRRPHGGTILRLSIGAPSSPILSNVLMYEFDKMLHERVAQHSVTYTRYADDLTFSARRTGYLNSVNRILRSTISQVQLPKIKINEEKTVVATEKYRRQVTGLILTNDKRVSLGRERKRNLRAALHHFREGKLDIDQSVKLAGLMAFARDVEPEFYTRMELTYGKDLLSQLKYLVKGYRRPEYR